MPELKTITFPAWPTWNYQFAEKDVMLIHRLSYYAAEDAPPQLALPAPGDEFDDYVQGDEEQPAAPPPADVPPRVLAEDHYRLAIGRNGVSTLVLLRKGLLPKLATRPDAVLMEYEP